MRCFEREPTGDDAKNWADASLRQHVEQTRGRIEEFDESLAVAETLPDMRYPCAVLRWTRRIHVADLEGAEAFLAEPNSTSPGLGGVAHSRHARHPGDHRPAD